LKHNKSARKRPLPSMPTIKRFSSSNTYQRIHVQRFRWVAHKTEFILVHVVPYVQFGLNLATCLGSLFCGVLVEAK
jgi:hypothetical protein